jgi:hypothetical protein
MVDWSGSGRCGVEGSSRPQRGKQLAVERHHAGHADAKRAGLDDAREPEMLRALSELADAGYGEHLWIDDDGQVHHEDLPSVPPQRVRLKGLQIDVHDKIAVVAVELPDGVKGTIVIGYGPDADSTEVDAVAALIDDRDQVDRAIEDRTSGADDTETP